MNPQLLEILKKAKAIDKAAEKYDSSAIKKSKSAGLYEQMDGTSLISAEEAGMAHSGGNIMVNTSPVKKDVGSDGYKKAVTSSKLPPAIQKAMLENPIPQPEFSNVDVDENAIRELRGIDENVSTYDEDDETDMYKKPVRRVETQKKRPINENVSREAINIDEKYLRKLIASELTKALPKIIENYFDSRLVKENVQFKAGNTIFSGTVMPMPKVKGKNNI